MAAIAIAADGLEARLDTRGGIVTALRWRSGAIDAPLLRGGGGAGEEDGPTGAAAFPLVPFGGRLRGNAFAFAGTQHRFAPNAPPDALYLHGDGWLGDWTPAGVGADAAELVFRHDGAPYRYEARQRFSIEGGALVLALSVRNEGAAPLPFGLGWHPYFPLAPDALVRFDAARVWGEDAEHLPSSPADGLGDLDAGRPRPLPERRINQALEGWGGAMRLVLPAAGVALTLTADAVFRHAMLFRRGAGDAWFCFEPMSHLPGDHARAGSGSLAVLAPGEALSGTIRIRPERLA